MKLIYFPERYDVFYKDLIAYVKTQYFIENQQIDGYINKEFIKNTLVELHSFIKDRIITINDQFTIFLEKLKTRYDDENTRKREEDQARFEMNEQLFEHLSSLFDVFNHVAQDNKWLIEVSKNYLISRVREDHNYKEVIGNILQNLSKNASSGKKSSSFKFN